MKLGYALDVTMFVINKSCTWLQPSVSETVYVHCREPLGFSESSASKHSTFGAFVEVAAPVIRHILVLFCIVEVALAAG